MTTIELSGDLAEIAEVAGNGAALALVAVKGGTRVYIPKPDSLAAGHWLVDTVGAEAARLIAERFGGNGVEVPMGIAGARAKTWAVLRKALADGHDTATAARLAGVHQRTVRRHKNGHSGIPAQDDRQGRLL